MERISGHSGNGSEEENFGSRVSIVGKKKKRKKREKSQEAFHRNGHRARSERRESDLEHSSNSNLEDEKRNFSKPTAIPRLGLTKSKNATSIELEEMSGSESVPKMMDVVVDVHYANEEVKPLPRSRNVKSRELSNRSGSSMESSPARKFVEAPSRAARSRTHDKTENEIAESLDAIVEVEEKIGRSGLAGKSITYVSRSSSDGRDDDPGNATMSFEREDAKRPARKRWSKDTSVIELPGRKRMPSAGLPADSRNGTKPVVPPAANARTVTKSRETIRGVDNAAFESDHDEVLRIETDHGRKSTKIEIRPMRNEPDNESSFVEFRSSRAQSFEAEKNVEETAFERKSKDGSVPITARSVKSQEETVSRISKREMNDTVLTLEESEFTDSNSQQFRKSKASTGRKNDSSSERLTKKRVVGDTRNFQDGKENSKKNTRRRKDSRDVTCSSNGTKSSSSSGSSKIRRNEVSEANFSPSRRRRSQSRRRKGNSIDSGKVWIENENASFSPENASVKKFDASSVDEFSPELRARSRKSSRGRSERISSQETFSTNEGDELPENVAKQKKKKKKKPKESKESSELDEPGVDVDDKRTSLKDETNSSVRDTDTPKTVRKRRTKRRRGEEEVEEEGGKKHLSVTVHRADLLEIDYVTKRPMVKVHIVDAATGNYLPTDGASGRLQPMITGQFDFKENKSMTPVWEEELIFEHDFQAILKTGEERVVVLFEVLDIVSFARASFNYSKFGNEACWYKVAWAFLRPVGLNNAFHTDKKVRLQLYRPRRSAKKGEKHKCEVYSWWKSKSRDEYPSSLFVTLTSTDPRKSSIPAATEAEGRVETRDERRRVVATPQLDAVALPKWTRLAAQSCKIPNERLFETEASENGAFYVAFSNDGKLLACVNSEEYDYPIVVYEVEGGKVHVRFSGHKTFVYSLNWSSDDGLLLSVSSDQTGRLWDVQNKIIQHVHMLPHPSYVYCGRFDPTNSSIVATGCYDRVARIWARDDRSLEHELCQELEGHEGFVSSMCFQADSNLITADSVGVIILWKARKSRRATMRKEWHACRVIKAREVEGVTINTIVLHPLGSRLLVHTRNNELRMLELASGSVLRRYRGLNNQRIQTTACISPCGGLILCGDEDSTLNVWHLETGRHLARYATEGNQRVVTCVDYHPYDHVLAFSTFGSPTPVRVLRFNKDADGREVGLKLAEDGTRDVETISSFLNLSRSRSSSRRGRIGEGPVEGENARPSRSVTRGVVLGEVLQEDAKTRLRRLNDAEQSMKSRSASRLFRIIEKIDRILSANNSRSPDDLEAGLSTIVQDAIYPVNEAGGRSSGSKSSKFRDDRSPGDSSKDVEFPRASKSSAFELKEFPGSPRSESSRAKKRSKSAGESRAFETLRDDDYDATKTLSDSAANFASSPIEFPRADRTETSFVVESRGKIPLDDSSASGRSRESNSKRSSPGRNSSEDSHVRRIDSSARKSSDSISSPDSVGTYVLEKADFEKNDDVDSVKIPGDKPSSRRSTGTAKSGSDSSAHSNATFIVENEIPVPKPRRKKMLN